VTGWEQVVPCIEQQFVHQLDVQQVEVQRIGELLMDQRRLTDPAWPEQEKAI
jgi:hypothetical protein